MKLLPTWLTNWNKKNTVSQPSDLINELLLSSGGKSGMAVNWKTALQANTALACGRVIGEGLGQVPFKVFKSRGAEVRGSDLAHDHSLFELLRVRPNPFQTAYEFKETIGLHASFMGNAYVYKVKKFGEEILELLPLDPNTVTVTRKSTWEREYLVELEPGKRVKVPQEDIWHIKGLTWDGVEGMEGIKLMREVIALSLQLEEHSVRLFRNGAQPGGVLSTDTTLEKDQVDLIRENWALTQGGGENAFKTAILFGGLKYQTVAQTGVEAQHMEQRRFSVEEMCRGFHVLPIMVGHADKAQTYASAEQQFLAHVVYTMMPWFTRIEQSADINLLTEDERADGYYTKFMVNALMRGSAKDRAQFYTSLFNVRALSPNDIREFEDMNPYEGGDAYDGPMNNMPQETKPKPDEEKPDEEPAEPEDDKTTGEDDDK